MDNLEIIELNNSLKENLSLIEEMVVKVTSQYSEDLDSLMGDLRVSVTQQEAASTDTIERYYADLSSTVYFMCEKIEKLNILSDLSRAKSKEAYNKAYIKLCSEKDEKGKSIRTINENTSLAENISKNESILYIIYDQAYKTLKMKIDSANEMISTLKNILKRRIQEEYMNFNVSNLKTNTGVN